MKKDILDYAVKTIEEKKTNKKGKVIIYKRTFKYYPDPNTNKLKNVSVSWSKHDINSQRQAVKILDKMIEDLYEKWEGKSPTKVNTFGELVDIWRFNHAPTVKDTTNFSKDRQINIWFEVIPRETQLDKITIPIIKNAWLKILSRKAKGSHGEDTEKLLSGNTLASVLSLIRQITFWGANNGYMQPLNLIHCSDLKIPSERYHELEIKRTRKFLSGSELKLLIEAVEEKVERNSLLFPNTLKDTLYLDLIKFLALTGMRIGEVGALQPSDIDFEQMTISITKTLDTFGDKVENFRIQSPKTRNAYRVIMIDGATKEILERRLTYNFNRQEEVRKLNSEEGLSYNRRDKDGNIIYRLDGKPQTHRRRGVKNYTPSDYVFQTSTGSPVSPHGFSKYINRSDKKDNKTVIDYIKEKRPTWNKHVTAHTMRYTHISLLAEQGVPVKAIMSRVGHKNSKTTLEIYSQVTERMNEQVYAALTAISAESTSSTKQKDITENIYYLDNRKTRKIL
jgi:integrase